MREARAVFSRQAGADARLMLDKEVPNTGRGFTTPIAYEPLHFAGLQSGGDDEP